MKTTQPKVSIVTAVRNAVDTIECCLQSVKEQTYQNIEHIVIDGASTDGTSEKIRPYLSGLGHYERRPDEGLYHAMNRGIQKTTGDYILLLNADDEYLPEAVQELVDYKFATGCEVVSAQVTEVRNDGSPKDQSLYRQYNATTFLGMVFSHNVMLVPKAIYDRVGYYNDTLKVQADWDFTNRLWHQEVTCSIMRKPLMRMRDSGISNTDWTSRVHDVRMIFRLNFPFLSSESLNTTCDPREWDAATCIQLLSDYADQPQFCRTVIGYGIRRGLIRPEKFDVRQFLPSPSPHLSVVIPAFNVEHCVANAIESALSIAGFRVEIIVVDDGSDDNTREVIASYASSNRNVKAINQPANLGVAKARNVGVNHVTGYYISFLDADDEIDAVGIARGLEKSFVNAADLTLGSYTLQSFTGRRSVLSLPPGQNEFHGVRFAEIADYFQSNDYPNESSARMAGEGFCGCIYRTDVVRNAPFNEQLNYGEDSLFFLHALCFSKRISWVSDNLYTQNIGEVSAMSRWPKKRLFDTINWRMHASIILNGHKLDGLAAFVSGTYWAPNLDQKVAELHLSGEDTSALRELCQHYADKTGFQVPIRQPLADPTKHKRQTSSNFQRTDLKVNVVVGSDTGGAAIGSKRRVEALRGIGVDARIFAAICNSKSTLITELEGGPDKRNRFRSEIMNGISRNKRCSASDLFSSLGSVTEFSLNPAVLDCDVVHLHWITGLVSKENFNALADLPVVWTLADINALTGGCHYSEGCDEFSNACQSCHFFPAGEELPNLAWSQKRDIYSQIKSLTIICPSRWMADQVKKSSLLGDRAIKVIPNAMPINQFVPRNKTASKIRLGLPLDQIVILFGAQNVQNRRKGGDILLAALELIKLRSTHKIFVGVFGAQNILAPFPSKTFGTVSDIEELSHIYSAADLFVLPSREDNAPLTVAESLLCGTPVVSTPVGNVPEIVRQAENGFIAKDFSPEALSDAVVAAIDRFCGTQQGTSQQFDVRRFARTFHDPRQAAKRHLALYRRILE